jgi:hypothetical protein
LYLNAEGKKSSHASKAHRLGSEWLGERWGMIARGNSVEEIVY